MKVSMEGFRKRADKLLERLRSGKPIDDDEQFKDDLDDFLCDCTCIYEDGEKIPERDEGK
jgi:hypothetical protein